MVLPALTTAQIEYLQNTFPELSYDYPVHNNVHFAWFTTLEKQNVCVLIEVMPNKQLGKISLALTSFEDRLSYGTIFFGSIFHYKDTRCFQVTDLLYYAGKNVSCTSYSEKMSALLHIFQKELGQTALTNDFIIFGPFMKNRDQPHPQPLQLIQTQSPIINTPPSTQTFPNKKRVLEESINYQRRYGQQVQKVDYEHKRRKAELTTRAFYVFPDIQNDVYLLYTVDNSGTKHFVDIACIPDFQTSVMMNTLFRKIKENDNLDALEESDDEDEFENDHADKFVSLETNYLMNCKFNHRFKKWVPVCIV